MLLIDLVASIVFLGFFPGLLKGANNHSAHVLNDPMNQGLARNIISACCSLQSSIDLLPEDKKVEYKRRFLTYVRIIDLPLMENLAKKPQNEKQKYQKSKSKLLNSAKKSSTDGLEDGEIYRISAEFDLAATLNFPVCSEALVLSLDALTPEEVPNIARFHPEFFYNTSIAVLEAIPDYSKFTVKDVENSIQHLYTGTSLLDVGSAVKTLHINSVVALMESVDFVFTPLALENLKMRSHELATVALHDPRLLYQHILPYFAPEDFKEVEKSVAEMQRAAGVSKNSAKGAKGGKGTETEVITTASVSAFGNLIDASPILQLSKTLKPEKFTMLVFAYVVYTDILLERIFTAIAAGWEKCIQEHAEFCANYCHKLQEEKPEHWAVIEPVLNEIDAFEVFHVAINDLKHIYAERKRLLTKFGGATSPISVLLTVPFSWKTRSQWKVALECDKSTILAPSLLSPVSDVINWLWHQVLSEHCGPLKLDQQSKTTTDEIIASFNAVFKDRPEFSNFIGGIVPSAFFNILLGGRNPEVQENKEKYLAILKQFCSLLHDNFGNMQALTEEPIEWPGRKLIHSLAGAVYSSYDIVANKFHNMNEYVTFVETKLMLEKTLIACTPSEKLVDILKPAFDYFDNAKKGPITKGQLALDSVLTRCPELLGIRHLRFLAEKNMLPQRIINNLPVHLVPQLVSVINFDKQLGQMTRGLLAVPRSAVEAYLTSKKFRLKYPVTFINSINKVIIRDAMKEPTEFSINLLSMMTPILVEIGDFDDRTFYKLPEVVESVFKKTKNINLLHRAILHWLIMSELNVIRLEIMASKGKNVDGRLSNILTIEAEIRIYFWNMLSNHLKDRCEIGDFLKRCLQLPTLSPGFATKLHKQICADPSLAEIMTEVSGAASEPIRHDDLSLLIDKVFNEDSDADMRFELHVAAQLLFFGTEEQNKLEAEPLRRALDGEHGVPVTLIELIKGAQALYDLDFTSKFVNYSERKLMENEDKLAKRLRIIQKLASAGKKI